MLRNPPQCTGTLALHRVLPLAAALWLVIALLLGTRSAAALEGGFDSASLAGYARAQGGVEAPRVYAFNGTVYDAPGGRVLATLDGFQIARAFAGGRDEPGVWYVIRRAFLLYRAPGSGEVLAYYPDVRTNAMPAPALSIARYELRGDRILSRAVSGVRGRLREISLPEQLGVVREDDTWVFRRVLSPPDPQQKPIELTETVMAMATPSDGTPRIRSTMTKVADNWGFLPPGGRHLLHLSWRPVAGFGALADRVQAVIDAAPAGLKTLPDTLPKALAELGFDAFPSPSTSVDAATATHTPPASRLTH